MEPGNHSAHRRGKTTAPSIQGEDNVNSKVCDVVISRARQQNEGIPNAVQSRREKFHDTPEELVLVLHKLGFEEVDCGGTHTEPLQVSHEGGKERVVCIELYLACRDACRPTVSVTVGVKHATAWQEKIGFKHEDTMRTRAINDKVVIVVFTEFFLEPVHILHEISTLPQGTLDFAAQDTRKEHSRTRSSRRAHHWAHSRARSSRLRPR